MWWHPDALANTIAFLLVFTMVFVTSFVFTGSGLAFAEWLLR